MSTRGSAYYRSNHGSGGTSRASLTSKWRGASASPDGEELPLGDLLVGLVGWRPSNIKFSMHRVLQLARQQRAFYSSPRQVHLLLTLHADVLTFLLKTDC